MDPKQIEPGREAADDRPGDVAAVEESEPRDSFRRGLDPSGHRRQGRAHQERRWQQANRRGNAAQEDADDAAAGDRGVEAGQERHPEQDEDADGADAELEVGVDFQRVMGRGDPPRQQEAAQAHAPHERAQQDAQRHGRRTNRQLQELEPDDFINQRCAAAADEQQQQCRQVPARGHAYTLERW